MLNGKFSASCTKINESTNLISVLHQFFHDIASGAGLSLYLLPSSMYERYDIIDRIKSNYHGRTGNRY